MLTQVHLLLTYMCNSECDHCFLYCSPAAKGTFTLSRLRNVIDDAAAVETMQWVYFEGGEPFLFYPLMVEGMRIARDNGLRIGTVTNAYWATCEEDAEFWLQPLSQLGVADVSISDDPYHYDKRGENPARRALAAGKRMGMPANVIAIEKPSVEAADSGPQGKGMPIVGGNTRFRGRAVQKLAEGLPGRPWRDFAECPYEELRAPERVHIDPYGNVHVCQGLLMGNVFEQPLSQIEKDYAPDSHPICGPLLRGGPAALAEEYGFVHRGDGRYIDACHLCYLVRLSLLDRFHHCLAPRQVYGLA